MAPGALGAQWSEVSRVLQRGGLLHCVRRLRCTMVGPQSRSGTTPSRAFFTIHPSRRHQPRGKQLRASPTDVDAGLHIEAADDHQYGKQRPTRQPVCEEGKKQEARGPLRRRSTGASQICTTSRWWQGRTWPKRTYRRSIRDLFCAGSCQCSVTDADARWTPNSYDGLSFQQEADRGRSEIRLFVGTFI